MTEQNNRDKDVAYVRAALHADRGSDAEGAVGSAITTAVEHG